MVLLGFLWILAALTVCGVSPQVTDLTAVFGETVVLPCDGSDYIQQLSQEKVLRALEWTMMWGDVLFHQGEGLVAGRGYEGRVFLSPERLVEGDFSLELRNVVLSDSYTYECIWLGRRIISTIRLKVTAPSTPTELYVRVGNSVHLPCYGHVSKTLDPKQVEVVWTRDGEAILKFYGDRDNVLGNKSSIYIPGEPLLGNFTLTIASVEFMDQGIYSCFYRSRNFALTQLGTPKSIHLTVIDTYLFDESTATTPMLPDDFQEDSQSQATPISLTATPISLTATTPISVTSSHLAREEDEAITWSPEPHSDQLETPPWVRIGIIAGVLSLTALVLGILLATHQI